MNFFIILLTIVPILSCAQKLDKIEDNTQVQRVFKAIVGQYEFKNFYAENVYTEEIKTVSISETRFCLNGNCQNVTSPVYYLYNDEKKEYNFAFRLSNQSLCIVVVVNYNINVIEILPYLSKTHIVLANKNVTN